MHDTHRIPKRQKGAGTRTYIAIDSLSFHKKEGYEAGPKGFQEGGGHKAFFGWLVTLAVSVKDRVAYGQRCVGKNRALLYRLVGYFYSVPTAKRHCEIGRYHTDIQTA